MKKISKLTTSAGVVHSDMLLAEQFLKNGKLWRVVREKGVTTKFYQLNHQILRIDFTNRCNNIQYVKLVW